MARILRGNAQVALESIALWHERDISHSSAERVIIPDSTILLDYMLNKMIEIIDKLVVYPEVMLRNLKKTKGVIFSQRVLLELINKGLTRQEAYDIVLGKRLLINIKGFAKLQALKNIYAMLKPNGAYIMIECFVEPLERINNIRSRLGLERINVRSFNEYLHASFIGDIGRYFDVEKLIDRGSLYYFISRVFNAYLSGGKPEYQAPINKLAAQLTLEGVQPMQGYAPEVTYLLKKKTLP
jgi:hypothetical protein